MQNINHFKYLIVYIVEMVFLLKIKETILIKS